jgi:phage-related protein
MKNRRMSIKQYSVLLLLASLLWIVPSVNSQAMPPAPSPQSPGQDNDTTRQELASFDSFLDKHPGIADELRKTPALVEDREYVNNHPELQAYLQEHPQVREELRENPRAFMRQEDRFDRRDDDANRRELANFDAFLDKHPEIAEQLRKNPTLADNKEFLQTHPALQQFLQDHPGVREQLAQDPRIFMRQEVRQDDRSDRRDDEARRRELANFDGFLDKHPEIAEQLRKNPTLADNKEFLQNHTALQQFLQDHPGVREQLAQDPRIFMRQEDRLDRRDDDASRRELASFDGFLDSHPEVAQQLSKDPSLAKNEEYLENHPELKEYLKTHSGVQQQLADNPQAFMNSMKRFDNTGTKKEMVAPPKPKQ